MRLFSAINFTEEVKSRLYEVITELKRHSLAGNFTKKENLHLTLAFLGEVQASHIKEIESLMDTIDISAFIMKMAGIDKFKSKGEALYFYGIEENQELKSLQSTLILKLKQAGFFVDEKAFKPHITLARRCLVSDNFNERNFQKKVPHISMPVNKISLMKSERKKGDLIYSEIYKVILL